MEKFKLPKPVIEELFYMELKKKDDVLVKNNGRGEALLSPIVEGYFAGEKLNGKCCFAVIGVKDWETVCFEAYLVK